jgi:hypothetical protein
MNRDRTPARPRSTGPVAAFALPIVLTGSVIGTLTGCSTPEGSVEGYRGEAAITVQAAVSEVETTRLALVVLIRGGLFGTSADDTITTSEQALAGMAGTFAGLQPPSGADELRQTTTEVLGQAQDAITSARVATRRHGGEGLREALTAVTAAGSNLRTAHRQLAPGAPQ